MRRSDLDVYGITISGKHPEFYQKRYYGVAIHLDDAIKLVREKAESDGWSEIEFDVITRVDEISFAAWLSDDEEQTLPEVKKCQQ